MISRLRILAISTILLSTGSSVCFPATRTDRNVVRPQATRPSPIHLRIAATTTIEIALAWDPVPGATAYVLERSTGPSFDPTTTKAIPLSPDVAGYGDLGCSPYEGSRFGVGHHVKEFDRGNPFAEGRTGPPALQFYRLKVRCQDGQERISETARARQ